MACHISQYSSLPVVLTDNMILRKGKAVELRDEDLPKINTLLQVVVTKILPQGRRFRRTTKLGILNFAQPNEVNRFEEIYLDESFVQELVPPNHVVRIDQLKTTNKIYKSFNGSREGIEEI